MGIFSPCEFYGPSNEGVDCRMNKNDEEFYLVGLIDTSVCPPQVNFSINVPLVWEYTYVFGSQQEPVVIEGLNMIFKCENQSDTDCPFQQKKKVQTLLSVLQEEFYLPKFQSIEDLKEQLLSLVILSLFMVALVTGLLIYIYCQRRRKASDMASLAASFSTTAPSINGAVPYQESLGAI
ncbi:unnamed protein product [Darwinula stevensoni]|uniref:Uncharacterized protein n=1 Tax=Darwinula stevensoni TaxID=69355 RepID=A0A7R9FP64_9CRUS|nr:unnamed protein product [Darwinula stevensoni]CAG0897234.1 unnamed protein product [Darwinula stevensoni]